MKNWFCLFIVFVILFGLSRCANAVQVRNYTWNEQKQDHKQYQQLQKAAARYQKLKNKTEWSEILLPKRSVLKLNDSSGVIRSIKNRLEILGDLRRASPSDVYTAKLEDAVKSFQFRHGLEDDGLIGPAFIKALNVPLETRINQLLINMERIRLDSIPRFGKRIVANIPEYRLYVYEDNNEVLSMDIVVGKNTNPTIAFEDTLKNVVFSPYWNIPASIVKDEILPEINKNSGYLKSHNMEIIGNLDGLPVIRQKPGPENSMGKVKFIFPNEHSIYFHDTPAKSLFDRKNRAFSHGCIRLSQPFALAKFLLKDQPKWPDDAIRAAMDSGSEKWLTLVQPVPVFIIYYTAWVDQSGDVHFRDDIYGHDKEHLGFDTL